MTKIYIVSAHEQAMHKALDGTSPWTDEEARAVNAEIEEQERLTDKGIRDAAREMGVSRTALRKRMAKMSQRVEVIQEDVFLARRNGDVTMVTQKVTRLTQSQWELVEEAAEEIKEKRTRRNGKCRVVKDGS